MHTTLKYVLLVAFLFATATTANAQKFFNLTADEVKIDSVLPAFGYSFPLEGNYQDSLYTVTIVYPEYIDMPVSDIDRYKAISGKPLPAMPEVVQRLTFERKKASLDVSFCPLVYRNKKYQILVSFMLSVEAKPLKRSVRLARTRAGSAGSTRYAAHSVLSTGTWAKISVPASGVFELTNAVIRRAGFTDMSKVKLYGYGGTLQNETLTGDMLTATDDLKEVPTCTVNGKRLFYARGTVSWDSKTAMQRTRNPYSDRAYYFITQSNEAPLTVDSAAFLASFYPSNDDYHSLHEVDNYAWYHGGRNLFENIPINTGSSYTFKIDAPSEQQGKVAVAITAGSNSAASVEFNGKPIGTVSFVWNNDPYSYESYDRGKERVVTAVIDKLQLTNEVKITATSGGPVRLDYISLAFDTPRRAPYLATSSFPAAEYVYNITNQDLHAHGAADMIIIIPTSQKLLAQAKRLKEFHEQHDGMRVRIVPSDELINEFAGGTPDANAYRRYLKMLYDRGENEADMPKYLLLFGDCSWDNRMLTSDLQGAVKDDYLLCYESEDSFNKITCYVDDGYFCLLDDGEGGNPQSRDKLDMAVGRFPVTTEEDAKTLVDKTIGYVTNKNAGAWQNTIMFMGDDGNQNLHMTDANEAADSVAGWYPGYLIKKVMWDSYIRETSSTGNTYPEVTRLIKQQQAAGALIMDYAGHGSETQISHESVLRIGDFSSFTNANLPLWITASCDIMPFDGSAPTIGEAAMLNKKGGAVAFFGTTRTVYASYNKRINIAYLKYVLGLSGDKSITLGEAQRLAKNEMITTGKDLTTNKLQYSLLGDPAIALNRPTMNIVIDSINGMSVGSGTPLPTLKAGSAATVTGHIESATGDFDGIVTVTVRDKEETITCKLNNTSRDGATTAFTYKDRTKTLFTGSDNVKQGKFAFSFAIPKDIDYTEGRGLINVYAVNNENTLKAHGENDNFIVGGSSIEGNDSIGPSIYCYLNSPSFMNGGNVNTTPYFVAQITDEDGINATGNGIGHDLQLVIDGDMSKTYTLNENFTYDFGSYTKGSTYYSIPELAAGVHRLQFRAWDILNNSSTTELTFNVVQGLEPSLFNVSCTNNPASTSTTFIINHDRTGSMMDVEIDVFDMSGRLLWKHTESGVNTNGAYTVDWNLTVDGGTRLQTGVYLYRVRIASDGSSKASKAKKLIVTGNK